MTEKDRGFILVDDKKSMLEALELKATFINNQTTPNINFEEIKELFCSRSPFNGRQADKYLVDAVDENKDNEYKKKSSKGQRFGQIISEIDTSFPIEWVSYGTFLPTYYKELLKYKNSNNKDSHDSLLIGALTIDTVVQYQSTVASVFPNAKSLAIDIDSDYLISEIPTFQKMNGLNTNFKDSSLDSIHTNFLLHQLTNQSAGINENKIDLTKRLFSEIKRLLKPGGKLIMIEGNLGTVFKTPNRSFIDESLIQILFSAGFSNIMIKLPEKFDNSQNVERFMRSSSGNTQIIQNEKTIFDKDSIVITANK